MKSKLMKNNDPNNRHSRLSSSNELNCLSQLEISDLKELKNKNNNDSGRINPNIFKRDNDNNFESLFLKNLVDNLFEYLSEQNNKEQRLFNKMDQVPMLGERENNNIDNNLINKNKDIYNSLEIIKNANKNNNNLKEEIVESLLRTNANSIENKYGESLKKIGEGNVETEKLYLNENKDLSKIYFFYNLKNFKNKHIEDVYNKKLMNSNKKDSNINELKPFDKKQDIVFNRINLPEEDKSLFMKSLHSPNPFEEFQNHNGSIFFNSPNINTFGNNSIKNMDENNDKLNINFDLSRNSSFDYSEIFKNNTLENKEEKKLPRDGNLFYDDSFFEISSNEKKSELGVSPNNK